MIEPTVTIERAEPDTVTVDFEGFPLILFGDLAALWNLFSGFDGPDRAAEILRPCLLARKEEAAERLQSSAAQKPE